MISLRRLILRFLAFLARKLEGNTGGATGSIYYRTDRVFTSDDFSEIPRCTWALTFEEPVDIRNLSQILIENDLPLMQYQHVLGKT